jgi:hypothetical protein
MKNNKRWKIDHKDGVAKVNVCVARSVSTTCIVIMKTIAL